MMQEKLYKTQLNLNKAISKTLTILITAYQWTLSPDHGVLSLYTAGQCRFRPTCSEYTRINIEKHGIKGIKKGLKQLKNCHNL